MSPAFAMLMSARIAVTATTSWPMVPVNRWAAATIGAESSTRTPSGTFPMITIINSG